MSASMTSTGHVLSSLGIEQKLANSLIHRRAAAVGAYTAEQRGLTESPRASTNTIARSGAKALEQRIVRRVLRRKTDLLLEAGSSTAEQNRAGLDPAVADRIIAVLATTAGLFLLGAYAPELLWAVMAAGTLFTFGLADTV